MTSEKKKTKVINLIGGPGAGKTVTAALLFARLKILGKSAEYIQEVAKTLVWTKQFDAINNQHALSNKQYKILKMINGNVDYIITDGPLLNGLYYNQHNPDNVCDIAKTEKFIMQWYNEFENINLYLIRGDFTYEQAGRMQTEKEALEIERTLQMILDNKSIPYKEFTTDIANIDNMIKYILSNHS